MEQDRYIYEVDREHAELYHLNRDLQVLGQELRDEEIDTAYAEYLQAMLNEFYQEEFANEGWEV